MFRPERGAGKSFGAKIVRKLLWIRIFYIIFETSDSSEDGFVNFAGENLVNVILLVFILLYTNKIAVIAPCKRNRIETKSVF